MRRLVFSCFGGHGLMALKDIVHLRNLYLDSKNIAWF